MPMCFSSSFAFRAARRKTLVAKWTAKYLARGCTPTEIERAIRKRLYRERI